MAKKQTFGDKVLQAKREQKRMAKVVLAEKKPNGQYRFKTKMVDASEVKAELAAARS
jgi:hypothetical protein